MGYVTADKFSEEASKFLANAIGSGIDKGVEAVVKEALTAVGSALLSAYAPLLADLIFGSTDPIDEAVKTIVERVDDLQRSLEETLDEILDEVSVQFNSALTATNRNASLQLQPLVENADLVYRITARQRACQAELLFNDVRLTIEQYVNAGTPSSRLRFRRLALLPLHITATRLALFAGGLCEGLEILQAAFVSSGSQNLKGWLDSLSPSEIEELEGRRSAAGEELRRHTLDFYHDLSCRGYIDNYLDDVITPVVHSSAKFLKPLPDYDSPQVVTSPSSWGSGSPHFGTALDGVRWYYYIDIPNSDCLEGSATDRLRRDGPTYVEHSGDPAGSDCNRYWILDWALKTSSFPPDSYLASVDGYRMWFDFDQVAAIHRPLVRGDIVIGLYGPISAVLNVLHEEVEDTPTRRPLNCWDQHMLEWEEEVARLHVADQVRHASYNQVVQAEARLRLAGANARSSGDWSRVLADATSKPSANVVTWRLVPAQGRIFYGRFGNQLIEFEDDGTALNLKRIGTDDRWDEFLSIAAMDVDSLLCVRTDGMLEIHERIGRRWAAYSGTIVSREDWRQRRILSASAGRVIWVSAQGTLEMSELDVNRPADPLSNAGLQANWRRTSTLSADKGWLKYVHLTVHAGVFYTVDRSGDLSASRYDFATADWSYRDRVISKSLDWSRYDQLVAGDSHGSIYAITRGAGPVHTFFHIGNSDGTDRWQDGPDLLGSEDAWYTIFSTTLIREP